MTMVVPGTVSGNIKEFSIFDFPLLFDSYEEPMPPRRARRSEAAGASAGEGPLRAWLLGSWLQESDQQPAARRKAGGYPRAEYLGIQIPIVIDTFNALGANAVPMPLPEVYTALETGAVDGQENPYALIESSKYQEVQKYISTTRHIYNPLVVLFSKKTWDKLSEDDSRSCGRRLGSDGL